MGQTDLLSRCHPVVALVYFTLVLVCTMFLMHPLCLAISLLGGVFYTLRLGGRAALLGRLRLLLPMAVLATLLNPIFNHEGVTVLAVLPGGNLLTLESIVYGAAAGGMLAAVVLWFGCVTAVLTSERFLFLFGKAAPALSLILTMALGFLPRLKRRFQAVREAQRAAGEGQGRISAAVSALSAVLSWSLERAVDTADSMKSRGYGLPGRSAFSIYRWDSRDRTILLWLVFCGGLVSWSWAKGSFAWRYFPSIRIGPPTSLALGAFCCYLLLCLTPSGLELWNRLGWRRRRREEGLG